MATLAAFALLGLSACDDVAGPTADGSPRLSVLLTDAPGGVEAARVQVTEIRLQGETGGALGSERLRPGRALLGSDRGPRREETGRLNCQSCRQTGIEVTLPNGGRRPESGDTGLVLDFDVAQSFGHQAGLSGM